MIEKRLQIEKDFIQDLLNVIEIEITDGDVKKAQQLITSFEHFCNTDCLEESLIDWERVYYLKALFLNRTCNYDLGLQEINKAIAISIENNSIIDEIKKADYLLLKGDFHFKMEYFNDACKDYQSLLESPVCSEDLKNELNKVIGKIELINS